MRHFRDIMQTLTVTKARQNLGGWLKKAASGEEIGVIIGDKVIAFRPVPIMAADYAETEYGLTRSEVDAAASRIVADVREASAAADLVEYKPGMFARANPAHKTISGVHKKAKRG
jgi:antitoxin (DNA-binding transcriptional repressor) of toxin-antitoxin stability system